MTFGLSTHLFHNQRLDRPHLETIKAHGFDLIEVFATRTHFDYRDSGRVAELRGWLRELGMSAGSMHTRISPTWDVGTAIRYAESIGYKGLYTIEVSQDAAVRVIYNAILANLA